MKKQVTMLAIFLLMCANTQLFAFSGSGSGTSGDPYLVSSASLLNEVRNNLTAYYKQTADIDISSYSNWSKIGTAITSGNYFAGTYDGDGYKITGLTITSTTTSYNGLFGVIGTGGTVKNLSVSGSISGVTQAGIGLLAGYNFGGAVENCNSSGAVSTANNNAGGLLGTASGSVSKCYSTASVTATGTASSNIGGFIGACLTSSPVVSECYSTGNVSNSTTSASSNTGGFLGMATWNVANCYSTGNVTSSGGGRAGGFMGATGTVSGTITNCYSTGLVTCTVKGGFVGYYNTGTFASCYFDNTTAGTSTICGTYVSSAPTNITAKTTAEMKTASTFSGWSSSIWSLIDGSYPLLLVQFVTFADGSGFTQSITPNSINQVLGRFQLTRSVIGAALTSVVIKLNNTRTGLSNIKLWSSSDAAFGGDTQLGGTVSADPGNGNSVSFSGFTSPVITSGTYYFLTGDISSGATGTVRGVMVDNNGITISGGILSGTIANAVLSDGAYLLPVELSTFTAKTSEDKVELTWCTKTEVNNFGFEIQRALMENNTDKSLAFDKIGFVQGHNVSYSPKVYTFIDETVSRGSKYSYRLRQVDNDGTSTYSEIIEVQAGAIPGRFTLNQNYPNPFNPATSISYELANDGYVSLIVYDVLGKVVKSLVSEQKQAGRYTATCNASNLPSGIYFYTLKAGDFTSTKKMLLLK